MSSFKFGNRQVFVQVSDYHTKTETAREKEQYVKEIVPHQFKLLETSQTNLQQSAFDSCYVRVFSSQSQLQLQLEC